MPRTIAKPSTISEGINRRFFEAIEAIVRRFSKASFMIRTINVMRRNEV